MIDKIGAGDAMLAIISLCFKAKIDNNLTLLKIYEGINWKPGDVKKDIKSFLNLIDN